MGKARGVSPLDSDTSDEELLLQYRDLGDAEAFETLVHRYERPIYNYLLRYLRNETLAEEVFQATFFSVHDKCAQFEAGRRLRPWLYSIATHQAINALRREGRHPTVSLDTDRAGDEGALRRLIDLLEATGPSPPDLAEAHERAEWTRHAVDVLPDEQRVLVLLIFFQGLRYREVAEILELPLGTVKSRVHRALLTLNEAWCREHRGE